MPGKSYWFYLEPFVYTDVKGNDLLLYNTLTGKFLYYIDKPQLKEFILNLKREENLYALKVSEEFLKDKGLENFMKDISENFMGDMVDVLLSSKKPFIMPHYFDIHDKHNMQENAGPQPRRTFKNVTTDSIFSLNELTFFVNSYCANNCHVCSNAYRQFTWCTREKDECELSINEIKSVLDQTKACPIKNINIIGGDISQFPYLNELVDLLRNGSFNVNYYFHFFHAQNDLHKTIRERDPRAHVILFVDCATFSFSQDINYLNKLLPDSLIFLIHKDEEIPILESTFKDLDIDNITVQPYYNGQNLDFFKANVFSDYNSLSENVLDMDTIKARSSYNTLDYGKMYIKSNKAIYSNLNDAPLGKINEISMETAVVSELKEQGNWQRVRRYVYPCADCLLNAICPPLSNFEYASGINNSCNIWKNKSA